MASKPNSSEVVRIERAETAINNSIKTPGILQRVSKRGYPLEVLNNGLSILKTAREKVAARPAALGDQKDSTAARNDAEKDAKLAYQDLSNTAKAEFRKAPDKLTFLGLDKPMPKNPLLLVARGLAMFDNIPKNPEIKSRLEEHGYNEELIKSERAKFELLEALNDDQTSAIGAKQVTSDEAQEAMKALDDWMSEYMRIAKVALKDRKNLMEKIGIKVRAGKTKAQRAAPKRASATRAARKAAKTK